ncbi:MAG: ATP-binding protein [Candidatus Aminicenantes bacterium]
MKTLKVKSDLSELKKVRSFLKEILKEKDVSEKDYYIMDLSLVEVCINIIKYAYPKNKGTIYLKSWIEKNIVFFEIKDDGIPFDPRSIKKPNISEIIDKEKKGGLGVFLIRSLMNSVEYQRKKNQNILLMSKSF